MCLVRTMVPSPVIREKLRPSHVKLLAGGREEFRDQELRVDPIFPPPEVLVTGFFSPPGSGG